MNLDDKVSFFSGSTMTVMLTAPFYDMAMAVVLGLLGGFAGMVGKEVFYYFKRKWPKQ